MRDKFKVVALTEKELIEKRKPRPETQLDRIEAMLVELLKVRA